MPCCLLEAVDSMPEDFPEGWTSAFKISGCTWQSKDLKGKARKARANMHWGLQHPTSPKSMQEHFNDVLCVKKYTGKGPQTVWGRDPVVMW